MKQRISFSFSFFLFNSLFLFINVRSSIANQNLILFLSSSPLTHSTFLQLPTTLIPPLMTTPSSFAASTSSVFTDPAVQIPTFHGLKSSTSLALARHVRLFAPSASSSSSSRPLLVRAVSTVQPISPPFLLCFPFLLFLLILAFLLLWIFVFVLIACGFVLI